MNPKGNAAKGIFIGLLLIAGLGYYFGKDYLSPNKESKKRFQTFMNTEATIISQRSNGRVGKGATTIWTVEYKDAKGAMQTAEIDQTSFSGKENGEKIRIWYNPADPKEIESESHYDDMVN